MEELAASFPTKLAFPQGECVLTNDTLDVEAVVKSVSNHGAGATAVFIGTTRNSFKGKAVVKLEYQAYSKLAITTMADIVQRELHAQAQFNTSLLHQMACAVYHRLGTVPVGEASIVIAVSSPHRKEAFQACEKILEEVKLKAQIWKREYYAGVRAEDAQWKANV